MNAQPRQAATCAEGWLARETVRDVMAGGSGALVILADLFTPFFRESRSHWGLERSDAAKPRPGDELVPNPTWGWTHAIEIAAAEKDVWPWVAQIGATRAGFYSYQFLENLTGCNVRNAETVHPEWEVREGDHLSLHPKIPPLRVVAVAPGSWFVAHGPPDEVARAAGRPWASVTWAFFVDRLGPERSRLVSRYRCTTSDDLAARLSFGPTLMEPIGFAMDRRMLLGVKERAERAAQKSHAREASEGTS